MKQYTYRVLIESDGDHFHGYVPALPGCHTYGSTVEETKNNLKEAISVYLESLTEDGDPIPEDRSLESFETVTMPASVG